MPKQIFISHSTKNDAETDRIAATLEAAEYTVWVDHRNGLVFGTPSWDRAIREAIQESDFAIFVMSPESLDSEICGSECLLVRELNIPLYILRLTDVPPAAVWLYIKQIQYADVSKDFDSGMDKLIRTLNGEKLPDAPQALTGRITGMEQMRMYLPYLNRIPLIGRETDLSTVQGKIGNHTLQLVGVGGLGKSRLAAELALQHPTGAIWHRCTITPASQPHNLTELLRRHYGLDEKATEADILGYLQRTTSPLVIVDNAEDVPPADSERRKQYVNWIHQAQGYGATILLTSRVEWKELKPRQHHDPARLQPEAAQALLREFAENNETTLNDEQIRTLTEACLNHPRLLEWAGEQLADRPYERVLKLLREKTHEDVEEALNEMIRRTLADMVGQEKVGKFAADLLACLLVTAGSFDTSAALALRPETMSEDQAEDGLVLLKRWQFLRWDREQERYQIDDVVRQAFARGGEVQDQDAMYHLAAYSDYARSLKEDLQTYETLFDRFANHYIQVAEQFRELPPEKWRDTVERDVENITAVGDALVSMTTRDLSTLEPNLLVRANHFAHSIINYLANRREILRIEWLEMGLHTSQKLQEISEGEDSLFYKRYVPLFMNEIGGVWRSLGRVEQALKLYQDTLPLRRNTGDTAGEATTLNNIAEALLSLGKASEALTYFDQAQSLRHANGDISNEAKTLNNIGEAYRALHDLPKALMYYNLALQQLLIDREERLKAIILNNIGLVRNELGDNVEAIALYTQALTILRAVGSKYEQANIINNIGWGLVELGRRDLALSMFHQALDIYVAESYLHYEASQRYNIALILRDMHKYQEAHQQVEQAISLMHQLQTSMLPGGVTLVHLEQLLAEIVARLNLLCSNTISVMTNAPEKWEEWRSELLAFQQQVVSHGAGWANEIVLAGALLGIVDGHTVNMPDDNPYSGAVKLIQQEIAEYRNNNP